MSHLWGAVQHVTVTLFVYAKDEETAAEIEDDFALLIADIAGRILKQEIGVVVVLPKVLQQFKNPTVQ